MTRSRQRVVIENVYPEIDGGRFAVKRTAGQTVRVEADIHTDGQDLIAAFLMYREAGSLTYSETPMIPVGNDRWAGEFRVDAMGRTVYTLQAWIARFLSWQRNLSKKMEAGQEISVDLLVGTALAEDAAKRAKGADRRKLLAFARSFRPGEARGVPECAAAALDEELGALADRYPDRTLATRYGRELPVVVDPERARFSTWYELFPRSCSREPGSPRHLQGLERSSSVRRLDGVRRPLPPADPPDRAHQPQGEEQRHRRPAGGRRKPVGDRRGRRGAQGRPSAARDGGGVRGAGPVRPGPRDRDRDRRRIPVRSGPSVRHGAPRVVPDAPRRHGAVRREPPEEIRGHHPIRFRHPPLAWNSGRS